MKHPFFETKYDIRGIYPTEVNAPVFEAIGRAYAAVVKPKEVVVGMDVRTSGPELKAAMIEGLRKSGVNVVDVGILSTDMLYFAVGEYGYDGGLMVSASHNPAEYNGAKMILKGAAPLLPDQGFNRLKEMVRDNEFSDAATYGTLSSREILDGFLEKCLNVIDRKSLKPLRIVLNPNFGSVCYTYKALQTKVPFEALTLNGEPDGTFPKGRPDPLRTETRAETIAFIKEKKPDFGVAWDADGDRVFFYGENGDFVDGYYIVSILAKYFLQKFPGSPIIYDPRATWCTEDTVKAAGGKAVMEKVGHLHFKGTMRAQDAPYGGEMSAHHYFRDFYYCDNGIIPFLIIWQMVSEGKKLSELAKPLQEKYPISGEINFTVKSVPESLRAIEDHFSSETIDHFDGITVAHGRDWRANIRPSGNEPLLRLNVEGKDEQTITEKVAEISKIIAS